MLNEAVLQLRQAFIWQQWIDYFPEDLKFRNMDLIKEKEKLRDYHLNLAFSIFIEISKPKQIEFRQAA